MRTKFIDCENLFSPSSFASLNAYAISSSSNLSRSNYIFPCSVSSTQLVEGIRFLYQGLIIKGQKNVRAANL